jgi:carboxyl-terminal processing protease
MTMKINKIYLPFILATAIVLGILIGTKLNFADSSEQFFTSNSKKDKLNRLIDYIDYEYVDEVNTDSIVDVTVNNILEKLDPHSVYIPAKNLKDVTENMQGDFVGVGVSFYIKNDTLRVIRPLEDGPSIRAGIKAGDRILMADQDTLFGQNYSNQDVINRLKGSANTAVDLKIYRKGEANLLDFKIKRNKVPIKSVDAYYMLTSSLGYIKVNRFAESTYKEFKEALTALKKKGATQIALDVRDNPGGYLGIAEKMVDEFLEEDKLILFTKNKKGKIQKTYATDKGDFENGEVYVLINENSASASEIIAGALQDNDKGTIVGRRSYGKGLVQREMALGDGSAIRLTISRYYTPTGRSIQRTYENGNKSYYDDFYDRYLNGELKSVDSIKVADSLKFTTPKGKTVYGGGGIIPDVFVPLNTTINEEAIKSILRGAFMGQYVFEVLDKNRMAYDRMSQEEFIKQEVVSDALVRDFETYANERNFAIDIDLYGSIIKKYIKATIALHIYGSNGFEEVINQDNPMIKKVIELSRQAQEQELLD